MNKIGIMLKYLTSTSIKTYGKRNAQKAINGIIDLIFVLYCTPIYSNEDGTLKCRT